MVEAPVVAVVADPAQQTPPGLDAAPARLRVAASREELEAVLPDADAVFVWDFRSTLVRDAWTSARKVRWIHTASVGVDKVLSDEVARADVVVTNTRTVFERPMAEYVLALLLLFAKDLRRTLELQARGEWRHRETAMLAGRSLLLLGAGAVGAEIHRLTRAVGMEVAVVGRRERFDDPEFGMVHPIERLDDLLGDADAVVLALPLSNRTRHVIDERRLALMRPGTWLVNVGRGALVDEPALVDALRSGHVGAAGLDVFEAEPLPRDHPLWELPQVVISPHMSADRTGWQQAVLDVFLENLRRFRVGEPLRHVVDKASNTLTAPVEAAS